MTEPTGCAAELAVERYLDEIAARLPGSPRSHHHIVAELRSGVLDAADSHERGGLPPARAVRAAIAEFGEPALVADAFLAEIAASQARRVAVILLVTGPLVGLLWIGTAAASHVVVHLASLWHLTGMHGVFAWGIELVAVAATVTAWAAALGIASTGRLTRLLPVRPRRAPTIVAVAGIGAVSADALGLAMLAADLAIAPGQVAVTPAAIAAVASLGRILLARRSASRCLALRARLA
ncbi:MAG TPA: permease prefix domain 1-containing protein [Streptosporangiaceae bacterium]|nr:permease prefix domain 1-containing protein [Streptosporangiaceae bacterium]